MYGTMNMDGADSFAGEKPHICIPFEENSSFIARPEATAHLLRLLPFNESRSAVIWGLGGCGYAALIKQSSRI